MTTQTKTTHTPGPWKVLHHTAPQHDGDRAVYAPGNKLICEMNGGPNDDSETLANARLIASAPDLLDSLRDILEMVTDNRLHGEEVYRAANAIRKAEGRI